MRLAALLAAAAGSAAVGLAVPAVASKAGLVLPPVVKPAKSIPWKPLPDSIKINLTSAAALKADLAAAPPLSRVFPPGPQVDVPFNYNYFNTSLTSDCTPPVGNDPASTGFPGSCPLTLPWTDPRLAHTVAGCSPDQVALKWWGTATGGPAVLVSWAACDSAYLTAAVGPVPPLDADAVPSGLRTGSKPGVYGEAWNVTQYAYTVDYSSSRGGVYVSPVLHHALVRGLKPGELVFYRIDGPPGTQPFAGSFRVPGGFPLRVVAAADVGQVANTTTSLAFWEKMSPDLLLLPGDLSYADDVDDFNMYYDWDQAEALYDHINTFSPRWDSWARLMSRLTSSIPIMTAPGNHENEQTPESAELPSKYNDWNATRFETRYANYLARYPVPQTDEQALHGPSAADLAPITKGSDQNRGMFYATEVPGVATIISLSTYTFSDTYTPSDPQYIWLKARLAEVDREKTPWLVVIMHASFYTTAQPHANEAECIRQLYEPLFHTYGVDVVFSGHDHDYERSSPVYNYKPDAKCGTVYLVVGNPGGDELNYGWLDQHDLFVANPALLAYSDPYGLDKAKTCLNSTGGYAWDPPPFMATAPGQWGRDGRCVTQKIADGGSWCPDAQPAYSRYREDEYGAGFIDFLSPTKAVWRYYSHARGLDKPADEVIITRHPDCAAKKGMGDALDSAKEAVHAFASGLKDRAAAGKVSAVLDPKAGAAGLAQEVGEGVDALKVLANFTLAHKLGG